jgi:type IV fimbrial biogenesis protein FimT
MRAVRQCAGFTLVELLVVVAIAAILQAIAVPAMADFVSSSRQTTAINTLLASLHLARSEAIKRNQRAVVCKSATGQACSTAGDWGQGWVVFHDANNNAQLDSGEVVLVRQEAIPDSVRLTGNQPVSRYVSYTPTGSTEYVSGAFQAGTLTVCADVEGPVSAKQIIISSSGRPRTVRTTLTSCP